MGVEGVPSPGRPSLGDVLSRSHLPALDGLRAVSVLLVIGLHSWYALGLSKRSVYHELAYVPGDLGVSLFFVLSGFLITRLLLAEQRDTGDLSLPRFYLRRTLRIFPAYYCFIALAWALDNHHRVWTGVTLAAASGYVWNYFALAHPSGQSHGPEFGGHLWSLSIEEQFYLLWPFALKQLLRRRIEGTGRVVAGVIVAIAVWRSLLVLTHSVSTDYAYSATDCRLDTLMVGCLLAIWSSEPWFQSIARATVKWVGLPLVTLGLLGICRYALPDIWRYGPGLTIEALLLATFLLQVLQLHGTRTWGWLDHPIARFLGVISYPMYLYHIMGLYAGKVRGFAHVEVPLALGLGATVLIASGSYYLVERPALRLRRRLETRLSPAAILPRSPGTLAS